MPTEEQEQQERLHLYQQYSAAYGPLATEGHYKIERTIHLGPGHTGEVIWKYHNDKGELVYVIDDNSGFPSEMSEKEIDRAW